MATPLWSTHPRESLRVRPGFRLSDFDRAGAPGFIGDKSDREAIVAHRGERLSDLQERLFAEGRSGGTRSVLLVLQGMDTSGKGGIVRHVVGLVDPQGVQHRSFGVPTAEEKKHHYLWRIRNALPTPGHLGVFDRSHYEEVLVVRVHDLVPRDPWEERYAEINAFEAEITAAGTAIVKCALMVSPEEQLRRLSERLERPDKYWKYKPSDIDERGHWDAYMDAYQALFDATSTDIAPWFVIPADNKRFSRLAVSELLIDAFESLQLGWPAPEFDLDVEKARLAALIADAQRANGA